MHKKKQNIRHETLPDGTMLVHIFEGGEITTEVEFRGRLTVLEEYSNLHHLILYLLGEPDENLKEFVSKHYDLDVVNTLSGEDIAFLTGRLNALAWVLGHGRCADLGLGVEAPLVELEKDVESGVLTIVEIVNKITWKHV